MPPAGPPRDEQQKVRPHNHADIPDTAHVIRHTVPTDVVPDGSTGLMRIASGAYTEGEGGGMSVDIEDWMIAEGLNPLHYVTDPTHGATRLKVGDLRALGLMVGWDPTSENPHHCAVWGIKQSSSFRRKIMRIATTLKKAQGED